MGLEFEYLKPFLIMTFESYAVITPITEMDSGESSLNLAEEITDKHWTEARNHCPVFLGQ